MFDVTHNIKCNECGKQEIITEWTTKSMPDGWIVLNTLYMSDNKGLLIGGIDMHFCCYEHFIDYISDRCEGIKKKSNRSDRR